MSACRYGVTQRSWFAETQPGPAGKLDVELVRNDGSLDFRGPAVQGKRGERFIYLTWGDLDAAHGFQMFRRAKLMLDRIEPELIDSATHAGRLAATVDLTDDPAAHAVLAVPTRPPLRGPSRQPDGSTVLHGEHNTSTPLRPRDNK